MTSLTEVYDGGVGTVIGRRRRLLGSCLFVAGAAMVVGAIPLATTDLAGRFGLGVYEARELAGVLAGLGLPAVFVGIFAVLPAGGATRAAAAIGASLAVLGVATFSALYPETWLHNEPPVTVATVVLYAAGTLVTFWCLFIGVATFKTRNEPGGTARLEITDEGTVRVVTTEREGGGLPGIGGVGLFGTDPDGEVRTQTGRPERDGETRTPTTDGEIIDGSTDDPAEGAGGEAAPAGDGAGALRGEGDDPAATQADVREALRARGSPDEYCGNCAHFEYVRARGELAPYCGFHGELLEDMDACEQWEPNGGNPGA